MTARQEMQARVMLAKNLLRGSGSHMKIKAIANRTGVDQVTSLPRNGWYGFHLKSKPSAGPLRSWKKRSNKRRNIG